MTDENLVTYHAHVDKARAMPTTKGSGGSALAQQNITKRNLMRWDMKSAK